MTDTPENYLVFAGGSVAETVELQSLLIELKNRDPACRIEVFSQPDLLPLVERMPEVAESVTPDPSLYMASMAGCRRVGVLLKKNRYDTAIVLSGVWEHAMIAFFGRIRRRVGLAQRGTARGLSLGMLTERADVDLLRYPLRMQRFAALAAGPAGSADPACPLPYLDVSLHRQLQLAEKFSIRRDVEAVLGFCPDAGSGPGDHWPLEYYAEVVGFLLELGWDVRVFASDTGSQDRARQLCERLPDVRNCFESADFSDTIDLISMADVVLTGDTGLMHVAAALRRRVLAVLGAETARKTSITLYPAVELFSIDSGPGRILAALNPE